YYRQFCPIAVWLETNSKISSHECDRYFWQGLPHAAWKAIDQCLELKETNYMQNEASNFGKVLEAGEFVFLDDAFDADLNKLITSHLKLICGNWESRPKLSCQNWDSDKEDE
ncbi:hypothetical protein BDR04DRAFT_1033661, partial [Suillus decipiens]